MPPKLKSYLLPALAAAILLGGFLVVGTYLPDSRGKKRHRASEGENEGVEVVARPHGRVLYVVVDADGCFLGEEFVPFPGLRKCLADHAAEWVPEYVIVCGTDRSQYGHVVEALDSVRAVFKVPSTMETRTLPAGTRRGPIEVDRRPWGRP